MEIPCMAEICFNGKLIKSGVNAEGGVLYVLDYEEEREIKKKEFTKIAKKLGLEYDELKWLINEIKEG